MQQKTALIDLRLKEYKEDYELLLKDTVELEDIPVDENLQTTLIRIQTIALDCTQHIQRGRLEEKDPLIRYLQKWVMVIDQEFSQLSKSLAFESAARS